MDTFDYSGTEASQMRVPSLRLHATGQYFFVLRKKSIYLGREKAAAEKKYRELIAAHFAVNQISCGSTITVGEMLKSYIEFKISQADPRWKKSRAHTLHQATRHAIELYGKLQVSAFGPLALQSVRSAMCSEGRSRSYVNGLISKLKAAFKWAVSQELLSQENYARLLSVPGLTAGDGPEGRDVKPVSLELLEKTLPFLSAQNADIIRLLLLTGARPDEIVRLRPSEITRGEVWVYEPVHHKTKRKNKRRAIVFGVQGQEILLRYSPQSDESFYFPGSQDGHLSVAAIRQSVMRACRRAELPHWHPYQIRHRVLTDISLRLGADYAQAVGGHSKAATTRIYDHSAIEKAKKAVG